MPSCSWSNQFARSDRLRNDANSAEAFGGHALALNGSKYRNRITSAAGSFGTRRTPLRAREGFGSPHEATDKNQVKDSSSLLKQNAKSSTSEAWAKSGSDRSRKSAVRAVCAVIMLAVAAMIRTETVATGAVEMALFRKRDVSTPLAAPRRLAKNSSICISGVQRNRVQNGARGTRPMSVLQLTQFIEGPKERPFQASLVTGELGEGVPLFGVGVDRASEEDLVSVPLVASARKGFARFRMCSLVSDIVPPLKFEALLV